MIRDSLIPALRQRYPSVKFTFFDSPQPFARVASHHGDIGDLEIYDDGDEATVAITQITHGHFNPYQKMPESERDKWIAEAVIEFLDALFDDRVLFYRSPDRRGGGWQIHNEKIDRSRPVPGTEHYECFVWSGSVASGG
jgi:hypothetical protein